MTDSLREQIAERLNQIWCAWEWDGGRETPCPTLASGEWGDGYVNNCLAVASEVIRIAEWARHGGIAWAQTEEEASYEWRAAHPDHDPLALPPDEWHPDA